MGAVSARFQKIAMAGSQGSVLVQIDDSNNGEHGGGGDRQSLAARWLENSRKWKKMVRSSRVTSNDPNGDGWWGWSQNVSCRVRKVSKVRIDGVWPMTYRKTAGKG